MTYSHFTLDERIELQTCLAKEMSCQEIAWRVGKDPTSVSREIARSRLYEGVRHGYEKPSLRCVHFKDCEVVGLCRGCLGRSCRTCRRQECTLLCSEYEKARCARTTRFPHVCNGCKRKGTCKLERWRYSASAADARAKESASAPRRGVDLTGRQLADLDALVTPLMMRGQSLGQIYLSHADEIPCTLRSLYTHVNRGEVGPGRMWEIDAVRRKPRKRTVPKTGGRVPRASVAGRSWKDYLALDEETRDSRWEMDTVVGTASDGKCLLTLLHRMTRLQLALLLASKTRGEVKRALDWLSGLPHSPFAPSRRTLVTTDNGSEFFDAEGIECGQRIRLYYCEAYSSWQKGACEANHRLYRRIVPKGTSFEGLDDRCCRVMMSHVNSAPRVALGGLSPIEAAAPIVGAEFLDALGVQLVPRDEVELRPSLLDGLIGRGR